MQTATDATFDRDILAADLPVLVELGGSHCPPCEQQLPILEEIERAWDGRLRVAKVDVGEARGVAQRFRVLSVPQLLLFRGGEPVARWIGLTPRHRIEEILREELD